MTNEELVALAIGGIALWMLLTRRAQAGTATNGIPPVQVAASRSIFDNLLGGVAPSAASSTGREITNPAGAGDPGYGWRYYDSGVAIAPDGSYYQGGVQIWKPAGL